jgi:hypothetical protein
VKLSFSRLLAAAFVVAFVVGFAVFVISGATTNKGTTSAIKAESATIMQAEKTRCAIYGSYTSIATLRREGLLTFKPEYNSVVVIPGGHCGTIVIGSAAYQAPAS